MTPARKTFAPLLAAGGLGLLVLAGCASEPAPTEAMSTTVAESVATVEAIDAASRQAILIEEDGRRIGVEVGPEVGSLEGVSPGDLVQVVVVDRAVARLASPDEYDEGELAASVVGQRDGMPASEGLLATRHLVEVVEVTRSGDTVRYRDADGEVHAITVEQGENRAFARSLSRGSRVVIDAVTTVSISVVSSS